MQGDFDQTRPGLPVLGTFIDAVNWDDSRHRILGWAAQRQSRMVCLCNVHSVVTALREPQFRQVLARADMATPDGAPIAWAMRRLGILRQERISGPDLMWQLLRDAQRQHLQVYFYGSRASTLERLRTAVRTACPRLEIAGMHAPPYRLLQPAEQQEITASINASGANLVFVGLGCPKQESWMAAQLGTVRAVMLGVGAAFDFYAGVVRRAPPWMQQHGFEWLYRLGQEPRRLAPRYLVTNSIFALALSRQLMAKRKAGA